MPDQDLSKLKIDKTASIYHPAKRKQYLYGGIAAAAVIALIILAVLGVFTPAMKVARLGEWFNVKTAWHGPGDVSPVGHAANAHIDLAVWNFGIQESHFWNEQAQAVFSGCQTYKNGYMYINESPGLGVDINEKEAAKYPIGTRSRWTIRKSDGTIISLHSIYH